MTDQELQAKKRKDNVPLMELERKKWLDRTITEYDLKRHAHYKGKRILKDNRILEIVGFYGVYKRQKIPGGLFSKTKWERVLILTDIEVKEVNDTYDNLKTLYYRGDSAANLDSMLRVSYERYIKLEKQLKVFNENEHKC